MPYGGMYDKASMSEGGKDAPDTAGGRHHKKKHKKGRKKHGRGLFGRKK